MNIISLNLTSIIEGFWNGTTMVSDTAKSLSEKCSISCIQLPTIQNLFSISQASTSYCLSAASSGSYYIVQVKTETQLKHGASFRRVLRLEQLKLRFFKCGYKPVFQTEIGTLEEGKFVFTGDMNNDRIVDATDVSFVDNDALNALSGYVQNKSDRR